MMIITGKQSVKKGVWYITGKRKYRRKQRGKGLLIGLLASAAVPILGEVAKAVLKKMSMVGKEDERKNSPSSMTCLSNSKYT